MVSSVDSNKQNEVDSRNRAESTRKESDTQKKHANEVSRLQQEHYEKLKKLQDTYQDQMDKQREASREAITSRDIKYQQEIEEMRRMNREKLTGLTSSYEDRLQRSRENSQKAVESNNRITETQKKVLSETLLDEIKKKDKGYQEALERTKEEQKTGMTRDRESLSEKHKSEVQLVVSERNDSVERLQDDLRKTSRLKRAQEKESKAKLYDQSRKMSDKFEFELSKQQRDQIQQDSLQKQGFDNSLEKVQKRYAEALEANSAIGERNRDEIREDVQNRQQGTVEVLERRLRQTKEGSVRNSTEAKRLNQLEHQHIMDQVKDNLEASERTRLASLEDSNNKNAQNIRDIVKKTSDLMHNQDTRSVDKVNMLQIQHEDEVAQKTMALNLENDRLRSGIGIRDKQQAEMFERDKKFLEDYYSKNLSAMKKNYDQSLLEQRTLAIKERNAAVERLSIQMRTNESKSLEKIALLTSKQEKDMQDLKSRQNKELDLIRRNYESRIETDNKAGIQNLESQKLKYETQLAQQKETFEERIRQMQKNFDQEKINMAKGNS